MQAKEYWLITPNSSFADRIAKFGENPDDEFLMSPVLWSAAIGGRIAIEDHTVFVKLLFLSQRLQVAESVTRLFLELPITEETFDEYFSIARLKFAESSEETLYPVVARGKFFDIPETGQPGVDSLLAFWRSQASNRNLALFEVHP